MLDKKKFAATMQTLVEKVATKAGAHMGIVVLQINGKSGVYVSTHEQFSEKESAEMMRKAAREINEMANAIDAGNLVKDGDPYKMKVPEEEVEETPPDGHSFAM